jgi:hypothetical protein
VDNLHARPQSRPNYLQGRARRTGQVDSEEPTEEKLKVVSSDVQQQLTKDKLFKKFQK